MTATLVVFLVVLASALLSVLVYAAAGPHRDADAEGKGRRFVGGLGDFFMHWFLWALRPLEGTLLRLGATPDALNVAALVAGLGSGILIGTGHLELGGWGILLSGLCDVLDGRIARARKLTSLYGKFIDSTLDRFVESFAFLGFAAYFGTAGRGTFVVSAALAGSLLVSYAQARGETVGVSGAGGLMQRAERMVLTCLSCLVDPPITAAAGWAEGTVVVWVLGFIAVGTFATAVFRTVWIARRLRSGDR